MNPSSLAPKAAVPKATVHDRKRRKNLAVLMLVLGWCLLIFLITMAKLAHADDSDAATVTVTGPAAGIDAATPGPAKTPFSGQRHRHEAKMQQNMQDFSGQRAAHQQAMDNSDVPEGQTGDTKFTSMPADTTPAANPNDAAASKLVK